MSANTPINQSPLDFKQLTQELQNFQQTYQSNKFNTTGILADRSSINTAHQPSSLD